MSKKALVTCPHCGNSYTVTHGLHEQSGSTRGTCPKCHKEATVHIKRGEVDSVSK